MTKKAMADRMMLKQPSGELVPLSDAAVALIKAMEQAGKDDLKFVRPSGSEWEKSMAKSIGLAEWLGVWPSR